MVRIKHEHTVPGGFHLLFLNPPSVGLAAEYSTEYYCMLGKGQPHIHVPALTVA